ncbi:MAG: hypothetical protein R3C05_09440 [Pirellulaceae bacterium]
MKPMDDIHPAVARATGERLSDIRRHGFSIADPIEVNFDPEPTDLLPQLIDWDALDLQRNAPFFAQRDSSIRP